MNRRRLGNRCWNEVCEKKNLTLCNDGFLYEMDVKRVKMIIYVKSKYLFSQKLNKIDILFLYHFDTGRRHVCFDVAKSVSEIDSFDS